MAAIAAFVSFTPNAAAQSGGIEGFLEPYRTIDVAAPEPGILKTLLVSEGERVEAGAVVAELNNDVLDAALQIAQETSRSHGKLDSVRAELRLTETLLRKLTELQGRGLATPQEIERASVERDVSAARLLAVEEELAIRKLEAVRIEQEIGARRLRAPIDGIVTRQWKDPGEYVSPAEPIVVTIVQLDPLTAVFAVPQSALAQLKPQGAVNVLVGEAGTRREGLVEFISPLVDPRSGTGQVKVRIPNSDGVSRSGERCRLDVATGVQTVAAPAAVSQPKVAAPIKSAPVR